MKKSAEQDRMTSLNSRLKETARFCVERNAVPELVAATLHWDERRNHIRLSFFLNGVPQDIELERLDLAVGEIIADHWQTIETAGTLYIFDQELCVEAANSSGVVFKR